MRISVERIVDSQENLVFKITVTDPHHSCFGQTEKNIMEILDGCKESVFKTTSKENKTQKDVVNLIHLAKETTFIRVLNNLKSAIKNDFEPKFEHICQEIYNWIQDKQSSELKTWMTEFDPQRTKYYFDNDHSTGNPCRQEIEHEYEFDAEWDDEEDQ